MNHTPRLASNRNFANLWTASRACNRAKRKNEERKKEGKSKKNRREKKRGMEREEERREEGKKRKKRKVKAPTGEFDEKVPGKLVAPACSRIILCIPKDWVGRERERQSCSLISARKTGKYLNFDPRLQRRASDCRAAVTAVIVVK